MKQLLEEIKLRFEDMPNIEKTYWAFFLCLILYVSFEFKLYVPGFILCFGILLGILAFENKEIPAIIISLFIAMFTFLLQFQNFNLEHRPYLSISEINLDFKETRIDFDVYIKNEGGIAKNLVLNIAFESPGNDINNPTNNELMNVVIFPHTKYKVRKTMSSSPGFSKDIYEGKKKIVMKAIIEYDGLTTKNHTSIFEGEYNDKEKTFVYNKSTVDI